MSAYLGSAAFSGANAAISINSGTIAVPVWVPIVECVSADLSGRVAATQSVTSFSSPNKTAEFITTLITPGDLKLVFNMVSGDPGQIAIQAAFNTLTKVEYQLAIPQSPTQTVVGDKYVFQAVCTEFSFSVSPEKAIQIQSSLKLSGPLTFTAGS